MSASLALLRPSILAIIEEDYYAATGLRLLRVHGRTVPVKEHNGSSGSGRLAAGTGPKRPAMANATILLVEDEPSLRGLLSRYLERQGYTVVACEQGHEAIEAFASGREQIDLAIVDLTLPDVRGETVVETLLNASPVVKVIVSSGRPYSTEALPELARPRVEAMLKPYMPQALLDVVARMLSGGDHPSIP